MKRLAVDMDGVLADVYSQFFKMHEAEFGKALTVNEVAGLSEYEAFPGLIKYVTSAGFFRNAPLMEDSSKVLHKLNNKYRIFIVSAATEFPLSLGEKHAWLKEHFSFVTWQQMVFCGSKEIIQADIMIDDHFKNLNNFQGETLLFTQPHNQLADAGKHKRVNTWKEIEKILL